MNLYSEVEPELRRYLLGEMSQEERSQVEERLFIDRDYFHQLQAVEDDLVDDYVYEDLSEADRERFESFFLSEPGRLDDLKVARALRKYISSEVETAQPISAPVPAGRTQPSSSNVVSLSFFRGLSAFARLSLATAALILLSIGIWLVIKAVRNQGQPQPIQVQRPTPQEPIQAPQQHEDVTANNQPEKPAQPGQEQRAGQDGVGTGPEEKQVAGRRERDTVPPHKPAPQDVEPSGNVVALLLVPGTGVRGGGETNRLTLSAGDSVVNLQLPLVGDDLYRSYSATLLSDSGAIRTWNGLKSVVAAPGAIVSVRVPAKSLRPASYRIKLNGITLEGKRRDIATYSFQVEKK